MYEGGQAALEWINKFKSGAVTTEPYIYRVHLKKWE